jgi:hypothetical protein
MEYRGKFYVVFWSSTPNIWIWSVDLDHCTVVSGQTASREAAIKAAERLIDRALRPKKQKLAGVVIRFPRDGGP